MRCTQNPTRSEEWRRGWHPERIPNRDTDDSVLIVGAGPAGLEAARAFGQRGYEVIVAEATRKLGGRVTREAALPGLSTWARVSDWRVGQIQKMPNVTIYRESLMDADAVVESGCGIVAVATGATWRRDGFGRTDRAVVPGSHYANVFTPDDIMNGTELDGPVVIFDDDHYYMGSIIAEKLAASGKEVVLVTPEAVASAFTTYTLEQRCVQARLIELGVRIVASHSLVDIGVNEVHVRCIYTNIVLPVVHQSIVLVTAQSTNDALYAELVANHEYCRVGTNQKIARFGDCYAPGTIAAAVWSGHRYAREPLGFDIMDETPFKLERVELSDR